MRLTKRISAKGRAEAFSRWELWVVVITLTVVFVALLLPTFAKSRRPWRMSCISNLKQISLGVLVWGGGHVGRFPMVVSTNQKGSLEFINTGEIFPYFQAFSNELYSPRVLTCPSDEGRKAATNFAMLRDRNLSYFLGLDSDETRPQTILSGDRNITTNGRLMSGIVTLTSNTVLKWTKDLHRDFGNIVLGDGSAQQVHNLSLNSQLYSTTNLTTRFAIP